VTGVGETNSSTNRSSAWSVVNPEDADVNMR
jgi:hypothetical protein